MRIGKYSRQLIFINTNWCRRLLSAAGIPKLRKKAKDHLKFKGKGHEVRFKQNPKYSALLTQIQYSDASRLLAFYQLWLDDLFPKARFLDALAMVEKAGHKKRMQAMRMEWINEGRPRSSVHEDSIFDEPSLPPREDGGREKTAPRIAPIFEKTASERPKTPVQDADAEMDDIYDATPRQPRQTQGATDSQDSLFGERPSIFGPAKAAPADDGPPEDDLDALLAEEEMMRAESAKAQPVPTASKAPAPADDNFDDEMEAMAEMDDMW
jgi:replication fork protection complex subunit Csm3/Swi3